MKKIYLAGPDGFQPDAKSIGKYLVETLAKCNLQNSAKRRPMKYSIPEISDERIKELQEKFTPLVRRNGKLFTVKECHPRNQAFNWNDGEKVVKYLREVARFQTLHTYSYHGFFKPSLAEVFAQLPKDFEVKDDLFFETQGPDTADDLNKNREALDAGFHVAETIVYKQAQEDIPKRDGSIDRHEFCRMGAEERLEHTSWVVECGSDSDAYHLWVTNFDNPNPRYEVKVKSWEDLGSGFMVTIGYFGEHPVSISLQWAKIAGKWICFYYACSRVVDHSMVDKWIRENFDAQSKDGRWAHTNPMNFSHCLSDIDAYERIE